MIPLLHCFWWRNKKPPYQRSGRAKTSVCASTCAVFSPNSHKFGNSSNYSAPDTRQQWSKEDLYLPLFQKWCLPRGADNFKIVKSPPPHPQPPECRLLCPGPIQPPWRGSSTDVVFGPGSPTTATALNPLNRLIRLKRCCSPKTYRETLTCSSCYDVRGYTPCPVFACCCCCCFQQPNNWRYAGFELDPASATAAAAASSLLAIHLVQLVNPRRKNVVSDAHKRFPSTVTLAQVLSGRRGQQRERDLFAGSVLSHGSR